MRLFAEELEKPVQENDHLLTGARLLVLLFAVLVTLNKSLFLSPSASFCAPLTRLFLAKTGKISVHHSVKLFLTHFFSLQSRIYFGCNLTVATIQPLARTSLVCKPTVYGHILLIHLTDKGLVRFPKQLLDPVTLTDVHQKVNECRIGFLINLCP